MLLSDHAVPDTLCKGTVRSTIYVSSSTLSSGLMKAIHRLFSFPGCHQLLLSSVGTTLDEDSTNYVSKGRRAEA